MLIAQNVGNTHVSYMYINTDMYMYKYTYSYTWLMDGWTGGWGRRDVPEEQSRPLVQSRQVKSCLG